MRRRYLHLPDDLAAALDRRAYNRCAPGELVHVAEIIREILTGSAPQVTARELEAARRAAQD